ncbi:MAG: trigger factor [Patescibacteria group bacterium]|jgi:trigger factor
MTEPVITRLPKSLVELKFVVTPEEAQPYLEQAAQELQNAKPIAGFRPGKAPYDEVKKIFTEMRIWETALERIVRARYVHTILEQAIESIGSPAISVEQLVPGQDIKFTVTAPVMPNVVSLIAYDQPLVTKKKKTVGESEVDAAIEDLRKMRRQEVAVDRAATKDDMLLLDLEIKKGNVPLEGGASQNYRVYLNEPHYIPGFTEQVVGLKKGDTKTFELTFPKDHYQKHLAGATVQFSVVIHDTFELALPPLDEEFAKGLGLESVAKLRELLSENLSKEAQQKIDEAAEIELLEKLVDGSKFSEVPELLVNEEVRRMFNELEHAAEEQGMNMADYLSQLKKSADEIKMDMVPQAIRRVQTAVLVKEVAKKESVEVADEEVNAEIDRILEGVQDKESRERVSSTDYRDYVAAQMKNRRTLQLLKEKAIKEE